MANERQQKCVRPFGTLFLCFFSLLIFGNTQAFAELHLTAEEQAWLVKHPILRHAPDPDYAPFEFRNPEGGIEGIAPDTLNRVAQTLGVRVVTIPSGSWDESLAKVKNHEADLVTVATSTPERENFLFFTEHYAVFPDLLIMRQDVVGDYTLSRLSGKTLAGIKGWASHEVVHGKYPEIQFRWVAGVGDALTAVSLGEVDGVLLNRATAGYWTQRLKITNLRNAGETSFTYRLSFAVRKDWPLLQSAMDKAMEEIGAKELNKLQSQWFSMEEAGEDDWPRFWWILAGGILIILLIGLSFRAWHLNRRVLRHTMALNQDVPDDQFLADNDLGTSYYKYLFEKSPVLVLILGLSITLVFYHKSNSDEVEGIQTAFHFQTHEMINRIQERMETYIQMLRGVRALFNASHSIERHEFQIFSDALQLSKHYPGIQGIGFALAIPHGEREAHIAAIRQEGFPDYTIRPEGEREVYTSIIFLEPFSDRNLKAFGYDMYTNDVRRAAMERSRDSDSAVMSGKVTLVQEIRGRVQAGFLIYIPIYKNNLPHETLEERRANLVGWAYSPFRMDDLMLGILGTHMTDLDLEIFDCDCVAPDALMYNSDNSLVRGGDVPSVYETSMRLDIAGHHWNIVFRSKPSLDSKWYAQRSIMIFFAGSLLSGFFSLFLVLLVSGRRRALKLAHEMTLELRESKFRWKFAVEGAKDGLWDWDIPSGTVFYSKRWKEMLGFSEEEMGNGLDEWEKRVHPGDLAHTMATVKAYLDGKTNIYHSEHRVRCKDGQWKWILDRGMVVSRTPEGIPLRMIGTHTDITQLKMTELELHTAKELAERATNVKSQFLASMSHDIRTPMNAILGMSEILMESRLDDEQRRYINVINRAGEGLLALINDILDLSKIEAGQLELEAIPFNPVELVQDIVDMLKIKALEEGTGITLEIDTGMFRQVVGDPQRIQQVLINLLSNAIKFTQKGKITIAVTKTGQSSLRFSVSDTGIGIPEDRQKIIFEPFKQADTSTTRRFGGTGLGLSICQKLVERMGGKIWVVSRQGQGSVFHVEIPFQEAQSVAERPSSADSQVSHGSLVVQEGLAILLADDAEENGMVIEAFLKDTHHRLTIVKNGLQAVEEYKNGKFDLVLMDVQMPGMDGYEATKEIRAWEQNNRLTPVPILALTANAMKEDIDRTRQAGCNLHLSKPIRKQLLIGTIKQFFP
ncbi:MAG: CHASE domain-containing protein [Nitrospirae bacterium]|nr:CHASE domain-containing protein [Magnetococcales bacterium]